MNIKEGLDGRIHSGLTPLFENISDDMKKTLHENIVDVKLKKGQTIFEVGQKADFLCFILTGQVKLCNYDGEGRENIIMILSDDDIIWESMFLEDSRFPYSGICLTETRILKVYRKDFEKVLRSTEAAMKIILLLSRKLHDANERNILLSTRDPKTRLAGFLLYRRDREPDDVIELKLDDIAGSIGLRQETVSRKIKELQEDGLILRTGYGKLQIIDYDGLRELYETSRE